VINVESTIDRNVLNVWIFLQMQATCLLTERVVLILEWLWREVYKHIQEKEIEVVELLERVMDKLCSLVDRLYHIVDAKVLRKCKKSQRIMPNNTSIKES